MKSILEAARKSGFFQKPISIKELGLSLRLKTPFSLKELVNRPAQIIYRTGHFSSGDVSGWADLAIQSNGYWSFRGHLHDNGFFFGDEYTLIMTLEYIDTSKKMVAVKQKGTLGAVTGTSRDEDWLQAGHDQFVAENWDGIRSQGCSASLEAGADPAQIWPTVMPVVALAGLVLYLFGGSTKSKWGTDERGNPYVEFSRDQEPPD